MLEELINLEEQCKKAVEVEQWFECSELFIRRMKLLEELAKKLTDAGTLEALEAHFTQLNKDMEIIQRVHSETKAELIKMTKSGRAISAYDATNL